MAPVSEPATDNAVRFAVAVSAAPSLAMLLGSALLMRRQVSPRVQAIFQNLSAGIILAAVASELFPLLSEGRTFTGSLGLTLGFAGGLATVFGVEHLANAMEGKGGNEDSTHAAAERASELLDAHHMQHIKGHLDELAESVARVDGRVSELLSPTIPAAEEDTLSEAIDEELHRLMYKLDHARRLLEGAEAGAPRAMLREDKDALRARMADMKAALAHLQEHLSAPALDRNTVLEVHGHMVELEEMLETMHKQSADSFSYWRRRGPEPQGPQGGGLPWTLIVPVTIDAFVDGFLIGLTCAQNHHGGLVLAFATCIEMAFLGAAFAATVSRCGASKAARAAAVALPPVALLLSAALGGALGAASRASPAIFLAFVAFGVVALLFLVVHELLIEAHESVKGDDVWWINVWLFVGIFVVMQMNRILPG